MLLLNGVLVIDGSEFYSNLAIKKYDSLHFEAHGSNEPHEWGFQPFVEILVSMVCLLRDGGRRFLIDGIITRGSHANPIRRPNPPGFDFWMGDSFANTLTMGKTQRSLTNTT